MDASGAFSDPGLCITTNSVPVQMDSGHISSNTHLGVNATPQDTVEYQKAATCSLMQSGHFLYENATGDPDWLSSCVKFYGILYVICVSGRYISQSRLSPARDRTCVISYTNTNTKTATAQAAIEEALPADAPGTGGPMS